jgi:hypothetical protein
MQGWGHKMSIDKKTIGLTTDNRAVVESLVQQKLFKDQIDAAKFAMALAIQSGLQPGNAEGAETIWNVGSFDADGQLKNLIQSLFPGADAPYRLVEYFVNAGLQLIAAHMAEKRSLSDLFNLVKEPAKEPA